MIKMDEEIKKKIISQLKLRVNKLFCGHNKECVCDNCKKKISGDVSGISGDVSGISGDVSGIRGNASEISGDVSGIRGNASDIRKILEKAKEENKVEEAKR